MRVLWILLVTLITTACGTRDGNGGVIEDSVRNRSLQYQIWLPKTEISNNKFPLVLLSHGSGGDYTNHSWLIDSLTGNGFIVAAVNHHGNTARNNTDEGVASVWERPADLSLLLNKILEEKRWSDMIDEERIGAAGFSSGGYTVLAMVGARYDRKLMQNYCSSEERGKDCELASNLSNVDYTNSSLSYLDKRIKAAFAMAPAVGPAMTKNSLNEIDSPVSIVAAKDDELVNPRLGAMYYAENISSSELHFLPSGGHFIFLECNVLIKVVDWFNNELDLCGTQFDVNRKEVRKDIASKAIEFFSREIGEASL